MKGFRLRFNKTLLVALAIVSFFFWQMVSSTTSSVSYSSVSGASSDLDLNLNLNLNSNSHLSNEITDNHIEELQKVQIDTPFMPQMVNETLKAELGNAAWKLLHTILARYPEQPNKDQRNHLQTYIDSFAQVYPCGDCARHFIKLLQKYPPQLNSKKNAAIWGCFIHNKVNERLNKDIYDCTTILEDYDCGCGSDEEKPDNTLNGKSLKQLEMDETDVHLNSIKVESTENDIGG